MYSTVDLDREGTVLFTTVATLHIPRFLCYSEAVFGTLNDESPEEMLAVVK